MGFQGSDIRTPSLDELARGGVRLERFYAQPMCTPSRAALMTGRYPHRHGLQTLVIPSAGRYGLPTDEWLLPQALRSAGYRTAIVGKWHLGHADRKYWPMQRGFDSQYGPLLGEIDYFTHSAHGTRDWFRDEQPAVESGYATELFDLAQDPGEQHDLSAANPGKVAALKQRIESLSREAVAPLIMGDALGVAKPALFGSVVLPADAQAVEGQP